MGSKRIGTALASIGKGDSLHAHSTPTVRPFNKLRRTAARDICRRQCCPAHGKPDEFDLDGSRRRGKIAEAKSMWVHRFEI
jgi:hypothetical protein